MGAGFFLFVGAMQLDMEIPGLGKLFHGGMFLFGAAMSIFLLVGREEPDQPSLSLKHRILAFFLMAAVSALSLLSFIWGIDGVVRRTPAPLRDLLGWVSLGGALFLLGALAIAALIAVPFILYAALRR